MKRINPVTNQEVNFNNNLTKRINLNLYFSEDFQIQSKVFKKAYKFLCDYGINWDEDINLQIETFPESLIALLFSYHEFIKGSRFEKLDLENFRKDRYL